MLSPILHDDYRADLLRALVQAGRPTQGRFAADCAERVLHFTKDARAKAAIAVARRWADGLLKVGPARTAAVFAHAAAREAALPEAQYACRAAGHAAATAHMAGHAIGACDYAVKAVAANSAHPFDAMKSEREWQKNHLTELL